MPATIVKNARTLPSTPVTDVLMEKKKILARSLCTASPPAHVQAVSTNGATALHSMANNANTFSLKTLLLDGAPPDRPNDYWIERYVRFTDSLDETAQVAFAATIGRHVDAAAVERFYRQFYDVYDTIAEAAPQRVRAFVDSLFS